MWTEWRQHRTQKINKEKKNYFNSILLYYFQFFSMDFYVVCARRKQRYEGEGFKKLNLCNIHIYNITINYFPFMGVVVILKLFNYFAMFMNFLLLLLFATFKHTHTHTHIYFPTEFCGSPYLSHAF